MPVQIHGMDADEFFAGDGDIDAAREIAEKVKDAELFVYPGDRHLFADSSLPSYDAEAAALLKSGCWSSWPASSVRGCPHDC